MTRRYHRSSNVPGGLDDVRLLRLLAAAANGPWKPTASSAILDTPGGSQLVVATNRRRPPGADASDCAALAECEQRILRLEEQLAAAMVRRPPAAVGWLRCAATATLIVFLALLCTVVCGAQVRGILEASAPVLSGFHLVMGDVRESLFELSRWIPMAERTVPLVFMSTQTPVTGIASLLLSTVWPFNWFMGV